MGREREIGEGRERGGFWVYVEKEREEKKNEEEKWGRRRLVGLKTDQYLRRHMSS